jgi:hypothetical protein
MRLRAATLPRAAAVVRAPLAGAAVCALLAVAAHAPLSPAARADSAPVGTFPLVAGAEAKGLPPLPARSPRIANYTIDATVDPAARKIEGSLVLEWRNTSEQQLDHFPFHLYWNAFRNNLSTSARQGTGRWRGLVDDDEDRLGWTRIKDVHLLGAVEEDLTPTLRYLHEDGNEDDRTVAEVRTPRPVGPGETALFRIAWEARIPQGGIGRAGQVHDYLFISQWFPKIGVFQDGAWNCHPFYAFTEFFADFGVYDVKVTLPAGHVVGATGRLEEKTKNPDGTETFHFVQEDVHDFVWTASRRFVERRGFFDDPGYPPVDIRLLVQPEHARLADRYIEATKLALRAYGTWSAPYPYAQITVVDPAWGSASGGMEYPTLFTGGTSVFAPRALQSPEGVTVHECGHQFWYGLVANNEFEESWLDEGFNTYMTSKTLDRGLGPQGWGRRYFGAAFGRGARTGWPVVAPDVWLPRGSEDVTGLRRDGREDVMARPGWTYRDLSSYRVNSYDKPALVLQTLEGLLGEDTMVRVLRTYARRYRFAHPRTEDFIRTVEEVTGADWRWFFDETFFSSDECDYAVEVDSEKARIPAGWFEKPDGTLAEKAPDSRARATDAGDGAAFESDVTVIRKGGVRLPVEVRIDFADGRTVTESWEGRDRWTRFHYTGARVVRALVDPDVKIAIDVDRANNEWIRDTGPARRAATKWAARLLLWVQQLLELQLVVG